MTPTYLPAPYRVSVFQKLRAKFNLPQRVKFSSLNQDLVNMGYSWILEDRFTPKGAFLLANIVRIPSGV